ncbi:MAG: class I SAM-dependent methyltransferase [Chloroflexi bacterium]|nr:MAG: class I SAM-dependent methyltransferase [Chloroflexota bacterium]
MQEAQPHRLGGRGGRDGLLDRHRLLPRKDRRVREGAHRKVSGIEPVQKQFGRTAAAYVESASHARGEDLDRIVALATEHGGERIVDVGTGVGHTLRRVAPQFRSAVGVDATREMLEAGVGVLGRAGVTNALLVQADATALPIASRSTDVVTSRLAAHHFVDAARSFRQIARILRPGGLFVLVDNFAPDDPDLARFINEIETLRDASHVRNHTAGGSRRTGLSARKQRRIAPRK